MVSVKQAAGVVLYTALNPKLRGVLTNGSTEQHSSSLTYPFTEIPGAFIVENEIYEETRDYANNDADAAKLWKLSEGLVGEEFKF